jgi:predicted nucleic acid-binding protein
VWWGTAVEIQSAFGRLKRTGGLQDAGLLSALLAFSVLQDDWLEIAPTSDLRGLAVTLVSKHPLRAADSLQLAAALVWCQRRPSGRTFISGDLRLCQTASLEGFTVIQVHP